MITPNEHLPCAIVLATWCFDAKARQWAGEVGMEPRQRPRATSNLAVVGLSVVAGGLVGVASVFVPTGVDSYERIDSVIGMAVMGVVVGAVVGLLAVVVRFGLRSLRN
jgi:hypothetical protein